MKSIWVWESVVPYWTHLSSHWPLVSEWVTDAYSLGFSSGLGGPWVAAFHSDFLVKHACLSASPATAAFLDCIHFLDVTTGSNLTLHCNDHHAKQGLALQENEHLIKSSIAYHKLSVFQACVLYSTVLQYLVLSAGEWWPFQQLLGEILIMHVS